MNKAEFKEKRKKLLEQRVRPTEGTEAVSAWDYDFNDLAANCFGNCWHVGDQ